MTLPITAPTKYKQCVIAPAAGSKGFDVFDDNGRWFNVKTQKQAKWWGSIYTRLQDEFNSHSIKTPPVPVFNHTPKHKEK